MAVYMLLVPYAEAAEQTILQRVVPYERQGRVFGFAQSVELAASPLTAFLIGPITQLVFIPFMTTGSGADLIGPWFGTGSRPWHRPRLRVVRDRRSPRDRAWRWAASTTAQLSAQYAESSAEQPAEV